MESKPYVSDPSYVCSTCATRNDPNYHLDNNLQPVWHHGDDASDYVRDDHENSVPQYHIPEELSCLTMCEKLLIRRCVNFVSSVRLKNGVFGLTGWCVLFPKT